MVGLARDVGGLAAGDKVLLLGERLREERLTFLRNFFMSPSMEEYIAEVF